MNEDEYREFLSFLFERYVRPRLGVSREYFDHHHFSFELSRLLSRLVRSVRLFRFIQSDCDDDDDIYRTFTPERLSSAVSATDYSVRFSNSLTYRTGFIDAIESHLSEIADGLSTIPLPDADAQLLREMGSPNPTVELRSLAYRAKRWFQRRDVQRHAHIAEGASLSLSDIGLASGASGLPGNPDLGSDYLCFYRRIKNPLRHRRAM